MTARLASIALVAALLADAEARADDYLEDPYPREGFMFGFALGPGLVAGNVGDGDSQRGAGGSVSLRLGTAAGDDLTWMVQLDSVQFIGERGDPVTNVHSTAAIAGQLYIREVLWLKLGIGTASLTETLTDEMDATMTRRNVDSGFGLMGGGGYDLFRRGSWTIDFEATWGVGLYADGAVGQLSFRLAANHY